MFSPLDHFDIIEQFFLYGEYLNIYNNIFLFNILYYSHDFFGIIEGDNILLENFNKSYVDLNLNYTFLEYLKVFIYNILLNILNFDFLFFFFWLFIDFCNILCYYIFYIFFFSMCDIFFYFKYIEDNFLYLFNFINYYYNLKKMNLELIIYLIFFFNIKLLNIFDNGYYFYCDWINNNKFLFDIKGNNIYLYFINILYIIFKIIILYIYNFFNYNYIIILNFFYNIIKIFILLYNIIFFFIKIISLLKFNFIDILSYLESLIFFIKINFFKIYFNFKYISFFWQLLSYFFWFFIFFFFVILKLNSVKSNKIIYNSSLIFIFKIILEILYNVLLKKMLTKNEKFIFFFLVYIFFFLVFANILGMLGLVLSSYFTFSINLSFIIWLGILFRGFKLYNLKFFRIFISRLSWFLVLFLILLELFSFFMRIISLGVRLSINMMSGHILLNVLMSFWLIIFKNSIIGFFFFFFFYIMYLFIRILYDFYTSLYFYSINRYIFNGIIKMFYNLLVKKNLCSNIIYRSGIIYPVPSNISFFWNFGFLALIFLIIQILTGIFLAMYYTASVEYAFWSIEYIMKEVNWGWLIRYIHSNGASMFFLIIYIHILRSLLYGSFSFPREFLWIIGVIILFFMIITGFLGYVLPWGQMSFWAGTVITNVLSAIPFFGYEIVKWIWGGFSLNNATLVRFFSFHYLLPFFIVGLSFLHILLLHEFGSNNPLGIIFKADSVALMSIFVMKDLFFFFIFLFFFCFIIFYFPDFLGHTDNYIMANPLITPVHIVPEWYFLPYYTILRSVYSKFWGVILLMLVFIVLILLPYLIKAYIRCFLFFPFLQFLYSLFIFNCLILGWVGSKGVEYPYDIIGSFCTFFFFFYFFIILPFWLEINFIFLRGFLFWYEVDKVIFLLKFEFKLNRFEFKNYWKYYNFSCDFRILDKSIRILSLYLKERELLIN